MTSIKDAIKAFEADAGCTAAEATDVRLCPVALQLPLITKMDATLGTLKKCQQLRLSTNSIDKITSLNGMESLQILSLGRNQIKKLEGLDPVAETLEQLWLSYNGISSLAGIEKLHNLQVLFMSNNQISKWSEVERLKDLPKLRDVLLHNNPIKNADPENWRIELLKRLPNLKTIDGQLVDDDEREAAREAS